MTALLVVILVCFIVVAIKGLLDWRTWIALGQGLVPQVPAPVPVVGSDAHARRLHPDHGHRRAGAAARGVPVLRLSRGQRRLQGDGGGHSRRLLEDGAEPRHHLGPLLRRGDRRRRHGAARGVHRLRAHLPGREPLLADPEHPGGRAGPRAGVPRRARLPGAALLLDRTHRRRVHDADLGVADDDLLLPGHGAEELALHRRQPAVQAGVRGVDHRSRAGGAVLAAAGAAQGDPRDGRQSDPGARRGAGDHVLRQPAAASASSAPTPAATSSSALTASSRSRWWSTACGGCCDGRGPRRRRPRPRTRRRDRGHPPGTGIGAAGRGRRAARGRHPRARSDDDRARRRLADRDARGGAAADGHPRCGHRARRRDGAAGHRRRGALRRQPGLPAAARRACCRERGVPAVPGCFTPTEILDASEAGAELDQGLSGHLARARVHQGPPRTAPAVAIDSDRRRDARQRRRLDPRRGRRDRRRQRAGQQGRGGRAALRSDPRRGAADSSTPCRPPAPARRWARRPW